MASKSMMRDLILMTSASLWGLGAGWMVDFWIGAPRSLAVGLPLAVAGFIGQFLVIRREYRDAGKG